MEPITHLLTGACIGRAGFNRKTGYATLAATLAAEAADLDMFWRLRGPAAGFEHHRGITHSFIGAPFVALFVLGIVWLVDRFRKRPPAVPTRWFFLWFVALLAALSHIFLDWTNSYGIRPFLPFNSRWYALGINAIWEPILFAALLFALVLPAVFGLTDREIGVRRSGFRGRGWAIAGLVVAAAVISTRWMEHRRAIDIASNSGASPTGVIRAAAEPYALSPFRWFAIIESKNVFVTGTVNTWAGTVDMEGWGTVYKPPVTTAVATAKNSGLARIFLKWARFPVVTDRGPANDLNLESKAPDPQDTVVTFHDLRYAYTALAHLRGGGSSPIFGITVFVSPQGKIVRADLNSRRW